MTRRQVPWRRAVLELACIAAVAVLGIHAVRTAGPADALNAATLYLIAAWWAVSAGQWIADLLACRFPAMTTRVVSDELA